MPIEIVTGDATAPVGEGPRIIVHVCNDVGGWGAGFVLALSRRWPEPEARYRAWAAGEAPDDGAFALGRVQLVEVAEGLWVANMVAQRDVRRGPGGEPPIRYEAIREGLTALADEALARGASVHMPRIGCGLAGGSWDAVGPIVEETLVERGVSVTVYDFG